ncbi:MAG: ABC transporter permease [Dehalococcoidia bacterium]
MAVLTIARLTLLEAARRRLLLAVAVLTLVLVGFTTWGFQRLIGTLTNVSVTEVKTITATLLILIVFMFSFIFSLGAVFVSAPSIATDLESGIALAMLPRPIRRSDLVLGKWLGLSILVGGYAVLTIGLEFLSVNLIAGYLPPHPLTSLVYLVGECVVLMGLALLISTRLAPMTGGIVALVLFGIAWMGGIAEGIGLAVDNSTIRNVGTISRLVLPTDGLWRGALFNLEPSILTAVAGASRAASANPFLVNAPPSAAFTLWAVLWIAGILGLTAYSFSRREL